jgi:hypothetical protein
VRCGRFCCYSTARYCAAHGTTRNYPKSAQATQTSRIPPTPCSYTPVTISCTIASETSKKERCTAQTSISIDVLSCCLVYLSGTGRPTGTGTNRDEILVLQEVNTVLLFSCDLVFGIQRSIGSSDMSIEIDRFDRFEFALCLPNEIIGCLPTVGYEG